MNPPDRKDVAHMLERIAILLQLKGENPFKVRAYENAKRTLEQMERPLAELITTGQLTQIKGIGASIAKVIQEYYDTGEKPSLLRELETQVPSNLLELLEIPGLGPGRVRTLHEKLQIESVADLEYALNENRLDILPGFGARVKEKIRLGIEQYRAYSGKFLIGQALPLARRLLEMAGRIPGRKVEIGGSLRRWCPIVANINVIVEGPPDDAWLESIMSEDLSLKILDREGPTWHLIESTTRIPILIHWTVPEEWAWNLRYTTGSKEFNQAWDDWAKEKGLQRKGIRYEHNGTLLKARDEREVFQSMGLPWIPPELREDGKTINRAVNEGIPVLVEPKDICGVLHVHSSYSDGADTIETLLLESRLLGLKYIGISDHSKAAHYAHGLDEQRLERQWEEIDKLQKKFPDVRILKGMEVDILVDGALDLEESYLQRLDFTVVSVHSRFQLSCDEMTQRLIRAMQHPCATILGHPTGRLLLGRPGYALDMDTVLKTAAETGTILEINANPHRLDLDWTVLEKAWSLGIFFSINPDTHRKYDLRDYLYGVGIARKGGLPPEAMANTRSADDLLRLFHQLKPRPPR